MGSFIEDVKTFTDFSFTQTTMTTTSYQVELSLPEERLIIEYPEYILSTERRSYSESFFKNVSPSTSLTTTPQLHFNIQSNSISKESRSNLYKTRVWTPKGLKRKYLEEEIIEVTKIIYQISGPDPAFKKVNISEPTNQNHQEPLPLLRIWPKGLKGKHLQP